MKIPVLSTGLGMFRSYRHIRETTIGNVKIGQIPTESRPSIDTCPDSCPFKVRNRKSKRSPCYSEKINSYHRSVGQGMRDRNTAWRENRLEWRARRFMEWSRAAGKGLPVRFLVHGDILRFRSRQLDREWISDVLIVARAVRKAFPGFRGWGYTHAWKKMGSTHRKAFMRAGITFFASVHNIEEYREAKRMGFRCAFISSDRKTGYKGPRTIMISYPEGRITPAQVCPQQLGSKSTCIECGICYGNTRSDIVLLKH